MTKLPLIRFFLDLNEKISIIYLEKMKFDFYKIKPKLSELISSDNKEGKSALGEAFANV